MQCRAVRKILIMYTRKDLDIILYRFIYFQLTKGFRVMAQYCNNPVTISGRPELMVSRANISPSSSGLVDKLTKILSTIFIVSTFPVDATAFAHRLMKSQLPQANDDVFAGSSLNVDKVLSSQREMAS